MGMLLHDENVPTRTTTAMTDCDRCGDLGLWMTPSGDVLLCPVIQMKKPHVEPKAAAQMVKLAIDHLRELRRKVHAVEFDVVRQLAHFTSDVPCTADHLLPYFGWDSSSRLRRFHKTIETLRSEWLLPVASRKDDPAGYWIATDAEDFQRWVAGFTAAPKTQLTTAYRLAKKHFPLFAGQLELELVDDMKEAA